MAFDYFLIIFLTNVLNWAVKLSSPNSFVDLFVRRRHFHMVKRCKLTKVMLYNIVLPHICGDTFQDLSWFAKTTKNNNPFTTDCTVPYSLKWKGFKWKEVLAKFSRDDIRIKKYVWRDGRTMKIMLFCTPQRKMKKKHRLLLHILEWNVSYHVLVGKL